MASGVGSWEASSKMTKSKLQLPGFRNVDTEIGLMSKQGLSACRTLGVGEKLAERPEPFLLLKLSLKDRDLSDLTKITLRRAHSLCASASGGTDASNL